MTLDNPSEAKELEIDDNKGHNLKVYSIASIMDATNCFSIENKLGEGGFGPVYKVSLERYCSGNQNEDTRIKYYPITHESLY